MLTHFKNKCTEITVKELLLNGIHPLFEHKNVVLDVTKIPLLGVILVNIFDENSDVFNYCIHKVMDVNNNITSFHIKFINYNINGINIVTLNDIIDKIKIKNNVDVLRLFLLGYNNLITEKGETKLLIDYSIDYNSIIEYFILCNGILGFMLIRIDELQNNIRLSKILIYDNNSDVNIDTFNDEYIDKSISKYIEDYANIKDASSIYSHSKKYINVVLFDGNKQ